MAEYLATNTMQLNNAVKTENPTRAPEILYAGLKETLSKCYRMAGGGTQSEEKSTLQLFCERNIDHHDYPILMDAIQEQKMQYAGALTRKCPATNGGSTSPLFLLLILERFFDIWPKRMVGRRNQLHTPAKPH